MARTTYKHLNLNDLNKDKIVYLSPAHAPSMVTTIGPKGNINVATFEQTMVVSYKPPRLMLAIAPTCDTHKNIVDGSDCVVGFPYPDKVQITYDCGVKIPRDMSEIDVVDGLSVYDSKYVMAPSIEQCWINIECKLGEVVSAGDHHAVFLDVLHVTLDELLWHKDKVDRRNGLPAMYYTSSGHFFALGKGSKVSLSKGLVHFRNGD